MSSQHLGTVIAPCAYEDHLHELLDYAALLENQYSKTRAQRCNANNTNMSNGNGNNNGQQGGRRNGHQGCGCGCGNGGGHSNGGHGRGHGDGGRGSGGRGNRSKNYIDPECWNSMLWEERQAIIEASKCARSANNVNTNGGQDNESTIASPPTTINVANGVDGSNNTNCQANGTNQMIRSMMSNASVHSANTSNGGHQDEITVNGTTCGSINAAVHYHISQQANNSKARGALVDSGANGGLLGEDARILEHVLNDYVNITGVAGNKLANLKLAQAAALVNTMEDGPIIIIMLQHTNYGIGQTVHSKGQMEHFGAVIATSCVMLVGNNVP